MYIQENCKALIAFGGVGESGMGAEAAHTGTGFGTLR